jgi:predicted nucleic acid-binding protein
MFKRKAITVDTAGKLLQAYAAIPIRQTDVLLQQAVELSARLNIYAYDAYVLACALNHSAPILSLDIGLKARAREIRLNVLEVMTQ